VHDILVVVVHSIVTVIRPIKPGGLRAVVAEIGAYSASNPHPESQSKASSQPARFRSHYRRFMHPSPAPISHAAMRHCPKAIDAAAFPSRTDLSVANYKNRPEFRDFLRF
jgi:hypothetical protein